MLYYTVQPGDTLYGIASYFGVTIASIIAVNPGINPYSLFAGQVILIPVPVQRPPYPHYPFYPRPPHYPPRPPFFPRPPYFPPGGGRPPGGGGPPGGGQGRGPGSPGGRGNGGRFR